MSEGKVACDAGNSVAEHSVVDSCLPGLNNDAGQIYGGTAMLTSPQRLPADRVQAARAAAAALAASSVRVGYVAAALARAGTSGGYPRRTLSGGTSSSSGPALPNYG